MQISFKHQDPFILFLRQTVDIHSLSPSEAMPFSQLFDLNPNKAHKVIVGTVKDGIKYI